MGLKIKKTSLPVYGGLNLPEINNMKIIMSLKAMKIIKCDICFNMFLCVLIIIFQIFLFLLFYMYFCFLTPYDCRATCMNGADKAALSSSCWVNFHSSTLRAKLIHLWSYGSTMKIHPTSPGKAGYLASQYSPQEALYGGLKLPKS